MTTKRSWLPSLQRCAKTFSILYVFYAFPLSDSNDADRNLNWRNVKQMVPTRFGIREGLIALQELRMLTLVSHSVPQERHPGDLKKVVLSFLIFYTKQDLSFLFKSWHRDWSIRHFHILTNKVNEKGGGCLASHIQPTVKTFLVKNCLLYLISWRRCLKCFKWLPRAWMHE